MSTILLFLCFKHFLGFAYVASNGNGGGVTIVDIATVAMLAIA